MKLNARQTSLLQALADAGCVSPVSRQEIMDACEASGAYACPPSWLSQDSARKVGRGLYDCPELAAFTGGESVATESPAPAESVPVQSPVQGAVETVAPTTVVEKIVRSRQFYPIYVTGLSGNGKTLMVEQVCAKLKRECYRVNITRQTDEDDLLGGFRLINGQTVWQDGPVVTAMKQGGVLLLDEIDLGSANLMCLQPVLEGKGVFLKKIGQWVTPAAGFTVFATANTKGKGSDDGRFVGTGVMNEAMLDRFPVTLEQPYPTKATEKKILVKAGCDDADFATHLTAWSEIIRKSFYEGAVDEIVSTRRLVDIVNAWQIFGDKSKAIAMCLARFDDDTKEAFLSLYGKVDADTEMTSESSEGVTTSNDTECPF